MAHKNPGMKTDIVELSNSKNARKRATIKSSPTGHFTFRTVSHLVSLPHGYNYALLFERVFSITLGAVMLFLLCLVIIKFSCFIITPSNCLASY